MIDENLHKLLGWLAGVVATWLLNHYNIVIDPVWLTGAFVGISLLVSTLISKRTNPTGANSKDAKIALEGVVRQDVIARTGQHPTDFYDKYQAKRNIDHDRE